MDERTGAYWEVGDVGRNFAIHALEYVRLVRGGAIRAARLQQQTLERRARDEAARFRRAVKRAWPGARGEGREEEQPHAQVESPTSHSERNQYATVFALHGPPHVPEKAAHSGAATAKMRSEARGTATDDDASVRQAQGSKSAGKRPADMTGKAMEGRRAEKKSKDAQIDRARSGGGEAGSSAMHANENEAERTGAQHKRKREQAMTHEYATRAFAAHAEGACKADVVMLGGVHVIVTDARRTGGEKHQAGWEDTARDEERDEQDSDDNVQQTERERRAKRRAAEKQGSPQFDENQTREKFVRAMGRRRTETMREHDC